MGVARTIAPRGSRQRIAIQRMAKPVFRAIHRLERRVMAGDVSYGEQGKLKRSWAKIPQDVLADYLVVGYQNPHINAQSILARHFLVRKLFGSEFDELMREELEFCVETNAAIRKRAAELGVTMGQFTDPEKRAAVAEVCKVIADREDSFEKRWAKELAGRDAEPLRVLEFACGSANDYRYFDSYGLGPYLDYTGIDLNDDNIANARKRFPGVGFEVGSILDLPQEDNSVDYVLAFDIFEHLSIEAMEQAMSEAMRVAKKGIVVAFFIMVDIPEHNVRPKGTYHWNELSATQIRKLVAPKFPSIRLEHIPTFLKQEYGAQHSYNKKAWTLIAER
jgi:ubiquinone/menaquinone biosynthesis C-methylase UbiE